VVAFGGFGCGAAARPLTWPSAPERDNGYDQGHDGDNNTHRSKTHSPPGEELHCCSVLLIRSPVEFLAIPVQTRIRSRGEFVVAPDQLFIGEPGNQQA
jgi:hypothetical protein